MARRHVVRDLSDEEFQFVIDLLLDGATDREVEFAFSKQFNKKLAKSSFGRWRKAVGEQLADRYKLARYTAKQLLVDINEEGANKYQVVIENIEDRLLTSMREVIAQDPIKLLGIRQEEEKRRLKERELALRERVVRLEEDKARGAQLDAESLPGQVIEHIFEFVGTDPIGLKWFQANAKKFEAFLIEKMNASQAQT